MTVILISFLLAWFYAVFSLFVCCKSKKKNRVAKASTPRQHNVRKFARPSMNPVNRTDLGTSPVLKLSQGNELDVVGRCAAPTAIPSDKSINKQTQMADTTDLRSLPDRDLNKPSENKKEASKDDHLTALPGVDTQSNKTKANTDRTNVTQNDQEEISGNQMNKVTNLTPQGKTTQSGTNESQQANVKKYSIDQVTQSVNEHDEFKKKTAERGGDGKPRKQ